MVLSNAERQARHLQKLKERAAMNSAYEIEVLKEQVAALEAALNEVRERFNLPQIQLPKPASLQGK